MKSFLEKGAKQFLAYRPSISWVPRQGCHVEDQTCAFQVYVF